MQAAKSPTRVVPIFAALAVFAWPQVASPEVAAKVVAAAARVEPLFETATYRSGSGSTLPYRYFHRNAWHPAGPGAVIFLTGTDPHGIRNSGTTAATYHVLAWQSPGMKPADF